ncbi:hypothetical protein [Georgenia sp. SYP-B2076]|uniref:hypothetical protein n=1 Tax=Georgenia sp. SYP-B2076 TaxID=2495881 RepID=UPI000F8D39EA|nr:hypothetical protein [Georgenia sp. SYP-B2076]
MKIGLALEQLLGDENDLAHHLLRASDRHKVDHDIFYLARDLAGWSRRHVAELAAAGTRYGVDLDPEPRAEPPLARVVREKAGELTGRRGEPALLLLRDVRDIYTRASGVYADWELISQAAQGAKDDELVALAQRCLLETKRQVTWANAKLKESATQILLS